MKISILPTFIFWSILTAPHSEGGVLITSASRYVEGVVSGHVEQEVSFGLGPFAESIIDPSSLAIKASLDSNISVVGETLALTATGTASGANSSSAMVVNFRIDDYYNFIFIASVNGGENTLITLHDDDGYRIAGAPEEGSDLSLSGILAPGDYLATFSSSQQTFTMGNFDGQMIFWPVPESSMFCFAVMVSACGLRRRRPALALEPSVGRCLG